MIRSLLRDRKGGRVLFEVANCMVTLVMLLEIPMQLGSGMEVDEKSSGAARFVQKPRPAAPGEVFFVLDEWSSGSGGEDWLNCMDDASMANSLVPVARLHLFWSSDWYVRGGRHFG